jgi:hypothetical protein
MKQQANLETFLGRIKKLPKVPHYMWSTNCDIARVSLEVIMHRLKSTRTPTLRIYNGIYSPTNVAVTVNQVYVEGFTNDLVAILIPLNEREG